jgi:biopolymer transport protein ExbD
MEKLYQDAHTLIKRSIEANLPSAAVQSALEAHRFGGPVSVLAIGKAAWTMADAAQKELKGAVKRGIVITKQHDTNFQWREIVRIMNTQKAVMTVSQNRYDEVIVSIRTSDPSRKVQDIYDRLHYKLRPYSKRKFVVHRSEFEKLDIADFRKCVT